MHEYIDVKYLTKWLSLAMSSAILLAAAMMSLSRLDHCFTSMCSACAAICKINAFTSRSRHVVTQKVQANLVVDYIHM